MKHKERKQKIEGEPLPKMTNCYRVVDECGCVVGTYCCESSDMSKCKYESC